MDPKTVRSLAWTSLVLLLVGGSVGSPEAGVAAAAVAALCAIPPLLLGARRVRATAVLLLLASAGLAVVHFPAARRGMEAYRGRAQRHPAATSPPPHREVSP